ncbi:MAG: glutathione S-transferase family protein [Gammaproteobacteria bacterium]|jgi:glutathione S-transferase
MKWILHHYDFSNYSEKVRLVLGLKNTDWDSVEIPAALPKPDYLPLTGGYRRTPSLQIGADVYCDTRYIAEIIEELTPEPTIYPGGPPGRILARAVGDWAEARLMWPAALYITGTNADKFPDSFHADRAVLHRKPQPTVAQVQASAAKYLAQLRSELRAIEALFSDGRPYVLGDTPGLADAALYNVPWFLDTIEPGHALLDNALRTRAWMERLAAVGHGNSNAVDAAVAFERANSATPAAVTGSQPAIPEQVAIGEDVSVSPLDEHSPALGTLVAADDDRIVIRVSNERVQCVHVHFPRSGYKLSRARS